MLKSDYEILFLVPEKIDDHIVRSIGRLISTSLRDTPPIDRGALTTALEEGLCIVIARDSLGGLVGMGTATKVRLLTHWRVEINHVFINGDQSFGLKSALVQELVRWADKAGAPYVSIVGSANSATLGELYSRIGFVLHLRAGYWERKFDR